jgi:hypothetical protein
MKTSQANQCGELGRPSRRRRDDTAAKPQKKSGEAVSFG